MPDGARPRAPARRRPASSDSVTLPAFSNSSAERHLVALLERRLQIHQHQVIAAGRELDGLAGSIGNPVECRMVMTPLFIAIS